MSIFGVSEACFRKTPEGFCVNNNLQNLCGKIKYPLNPLSSEGKKLDDGKNLRKFTSKNKCDFNEQIQQTLSK